MIHLCVCVSAFFAVFHSDYATATSEESKEVELKQKGVRLYVKHGDKSFSEAIPGRIKLFGNCAILDEPCVSSCSL